MKRSLYFLTLWAIFTVQGVADSKSRFNFVILSEVKNLKNIKRDSSLATLAQNDKVESDLDENSNPPPPKCERGIRKNSPPPLRRGTKGVG